MVKTDETAKAKRDKLRKKLGEELLEFRNDCMENKDKINNLSLNEASEYIGKYYALSRLNDEERD